MLYKQKLEKSKSLYSISSCPERNYIYTACVRACVRTLCHTHTMFLSCHSDIIPLKTVLRTLNSKNIKTKIQNNN